MTLPSQGRDSEFKSCPTINNLKVSAGPSQMSNYSIYTPKEDSTLLEGHVKKYAFGSVLDMGTGSGIQAIAASKNKKVNSVLALDIQKEVIEHCKNSIKDKKITLMVSDLFDSVKNKKFDTIIFNPPYLPNELKVKDLTLEGGKKGYEVLERFLNGVNKYLKPNGTVLIIFSSLTKRNKVDKFIKNNLLESELLEKQKYFFEELYVYKIVKSTLLKKLEKLEIGKINYLTKGNRGLIFTGLFKGKKVAIKVKNPKSTAISRIENEINFLKKLNKKNIGPKLLFSDKGFFVYGFVEGTSFEQYLKINNKKSIIKIIKNILDQLFVMDKLKINKEEMSHPKKHIIIDKKPILLDFEKSHYVKNPSNVTQFCDYLMSKRISTMLKGNKININNKKLIQHSKIYKKNINKSNLNKIIGEIK